MTEIIPIIDEASTFHVEIPNILDGGIRASYRKRERTRAVLKCSVHKRGTGDVTRQRNDVAEHFNVRVGEADLHSGFITTSLVRGAAGKYADRLGDEAFNNCF